MQSWHGEQRSREELRECTFSPTVTSTELFVHSTHLQGVEVGGGSLQGVPHICIRHSSIRWQLHAWHARQRASLAPPRAAATVDQVAGIRLGVPICSELLPQVFNLSTLLLAASVGIE